MTPRTLPSPSRLLVFAVFLPAFVAGSNQLLFEIAPGFRGPQAWLYPWMAFATAVLSWCSGRYLSPTWFRWLVFAWSLILLDFLTIAACMSGRVENHFGFALVSAQTSMLVLWAVLATANWQWRLPSVVAAAAGVIVFSGSFEDQWNARNWNLLMIVTAIAMALICVLLRWRGFALWHSDSETGGESERVSVGMHQFGLKHMLMWATALVPILLVARGLNFILLTQLGGPDLFPFVLVALAVATVNLLAIWTVLGKGYVLLRLGVLLVISYLMAIGIVQYLTYVESTYIRSVNNMGTWSYVSYSRTWYQSLVNGLADARDSWATWLWLDAALLAALLLFLRASGYRLARESRNPT